MSQTDLKDAERSTYLSYFEDGIADILGGLLVLNFGLGMLFNSSLFFMFTWMPLILFWPLKRAITFPRMGYVKFTQKRQRKISKNIILLIAAGTISFILGIATYLGVQGVVFDLRNFMMAYGTLVLGAIMATAFALVAILFEIKRFYGYAALVFGGWLLAFLFNFQEGAPVAAAGGIIMLTGLGYLIRFLTRYPLPAE